jgi:PAS domain S-box-containing protein
MNAFDPGELARTLFEESGDALFLFDPDTEVLLEANPMAQRLSGFTRQEMLRLQVTYLFRAETQGGLQRLRHAYQRTGAFHSQEGFLLRQKQDGVWIPVNLTVSRLHAEPKTLGLVTARDIRERRDAQALQKKTESELQQVLATSSVCLWSAEFDASGKLVYRYVSPAVEKITGRAPEYFANGQSQWLSLVHPEDRDRLEKSFAQSAAGTWNEIGEEYRVVLPNGNVRWVHDAVQIKRGSEGRPVRLDGALTDITERKLAEEKLIESEQRFRALVEKSTDAIALLGADGTLLYLSPASTGILGYEPAELVGQSAISLVHPDDVARARGVLEQSAACPNESPTIELKTRHKNGTVRHIECVISNRLDESSVGAIVANFRDVTDRQQTDALLAVQRQVLEKIVTGANLPEVLDYLVRSIEAASPGMLGSVLLLEGNQLRHGAAPSLPDAYNRLVDGLVIGPRVGSCGTAACLGKAVLVEDIATDPLWAGAQDLPLGHGLRACWSTPFFSRTGCVLGTFAIYWREPRGPLPYESRLVEAATHLAAVAVERARAEEALRASEERYRFLFAGNPHPMLVYDVETLAYLDVNEAAVISFGYTRDEFLQMNITDIRPPEDVPALLAAIRSLGPIPYRLGAWRHRKKDGTYIHMDIVTRPLTYEGRQARLIVAHDVTERRRAEEALRASEEKYRFLIDSLEQCIILKDADLRFVAANRTFCEGLGLGEAEILGKTDFDFYPAHLAEKYRADDLSVLKEGKRIELEEHNVRNGELCTVRVVKTPARDSEGRTAGVLGIFWDVTQQRELEAQLRQAQKMEAVGLLAGGIAHDFNNLLTAILGNLSLLMNDLPEPHPGRELAGAAERASLRAADLTSQLLGFSRRTLLRPQAVDLNATVAEVVGILRRTIDPRISVAVNADSALWTVKADPGQLSQVLMNLCLNARDAMPDGGSLVLETANVVFAETPARAPVEARPGEFIRLSVRDNGCGIPPDVRARIFEPFFTTKGPGKGTGLGLAMVFGIVQQHDGWIECQSEPGRGTTFGMYIPRHGDAALLPGSVAASQSPLHGRETVLLVDDEEMIRNLGRTILQRYGYEVLVAEDGQDAIEVYKREQDRIDLVILDLTMPRLSGHDAFRQLLRINPAVRVLFASGYSAEHITETDPERVLGFVGKPYSQNELAQSVRSALEKSRHAPRENISKGSTVVRHAFTPYSANGGHETGGSSPP